MQYVPSSENAKFVNMAIREPVVFREDKRDVAIMLSMQEYDRLTGRNIEAFQRTCDEIGAAATARGLTEEKLQQLLAKDD